MGTGVQGEEQVTRKKSKYKPKAVLTDPMTWVRKGLQRVAENESAVIIKLRAHDALLEVAQGRGNRQVISVLIAAMNLTEALATLYPRKLHGHLMEDIHAAQDALLNMGKRGIDRGAFLFTGPELQDINFGMEISDVQLETCTVSELEKGLDLVNECIRQRRARRIV